MEATATVRGATTAATTSTAATKEEQKLWQSQNFRMLWQFSLFAEDGGKEGRKRSRRAKEKKSGRGVERQRSARAA